MSLSDLGQEVCHIGQNSDLRVFCLQAKFFNQLMDQPLNSHSNFKTKVYLWSWVYRELPGSTKLSQEPLVLRLLTQEQGSNRAILCRGPENKKTGPQSLPIS